MPAPGAAGAEAPDPEAEVPEPDPEVDATAAGGAEAPPSAPWLSRYDFDERLWYVDLPGRLDEVSGLAFDGGGRLFAHDDEVGRVHELDPETGETLGRFDLGSGRVLDDFEGIAIAGDRHFLVSSVGFLYEFRSGADDEQVEFRMTDSGVGARCEVEGLDVLDGAELLLACKTVTPDPGSIVLIRLPLAGGSAAGSIRVDRALLADSEVDRDFAPSGVAVTPAGTIALLSGRHEAIIEIDRQGRLLHAVELRQGRHPQSEGIAFGPDGTLYIADEKNGQDARLTAYRPVEGEQNP